MVNCLLTGNSAATGGGVFWGGLNNSTLVNKHGSLAAGGAYFPANTGPLNSILYDNDAPASPNYSPGTRCEYRCTLPLPTVGDHNLTTSPRFVDAAHGNCRLQSNSPCIEVSNGSGDKDLDGRPRYRGSRTDIGACEFQDTGMGAHAEFVIEATTVVCASPKPERFRR